MPSRQVIVEKTFSLLQKAQKLDEQWKDSVRDIGSFLDGSKPGSGLTIEERHLLMPFILNMNANERDFATSVIDYFSNINVNITNRLTLEIGLIDNNQPLSAGNLPLDVNDYVTYKFLMAHPKCKTKLREHDTTFQIIDPTEEKQKKATAANAGVLWMTDFVKLFSDIDACKSVLTALSVAPKYAQFRKNYDIISSEEIKSDITALNEMSPELVYKTYNDPNLKINVLISILVQKSVIRKVGDSFVTKNNDIIANNKEELMFFLKTPKHEATVKILKAEAGLRNDS
jgi:hypothetical protein